MRWPLFTWMLGVGIFGMFWFVYLSIKQNEKHWTPVAQYFKRHRSHHHRDRTIANACLLGGQCKGSSVMWRV